jgi:hypothetical protein
LEENRTVLLGRRPAAPAALELFGQEGPGGTELRSQRIGLGSDVLEDLRIRGSGAGTGQETCQLLAPLPPEVVVGDGMSGEQNQGSEERRAEE